MIDKNLSCGELTDLPNKQYEKFFEKFSEIDTLDVKDWKPAHLLAKFCQKYKAQYNTDYKFKFNTPQPSKCFEVFHIKRLAMLLSSNPNILKEYIDWVFLNKVTKTKRKITSISFITREENVNEYKMNILLSDKTIDRSTALPEKFQNIFEKIGSPITTYGDLAFLFQLEPMPSDILLALNKIKEDGFDIEILRKIT